jgi:hypothetical protein
MSEIKCNTCKITPSITNCITDEAKSLSDADGTIVSIMSGCRHFYIHGEQKMYDDLAVFGDRFVTSIDPKLRTNK